MINLELAKEKFDKYVNKYDMNEKMIKLKHDHSYRVMENSIIIAEHLKLDDEKIKLAALIGLLHDIGRFEQWTKYKTFSDIKSFDHGDFSLKILSDNNFIREFISDDTYDDLIKKSIKNHNKFSIDVCNDECMIFCKIVRDADKLDILTLYFDLFKTFELPDEIISDKIYNQCLQNNQIKYQDLVSKIDGKILGLSMIYDLNFIGSYKFIKNRDYINKLLDILINRLTNKDSIDKLINIKEHMNNYIIEKIKEE